MGLWPEKMVKVRIYATRGISIELTQFLHKAGLLHLEEVKPKDAWEKATPFKFFDELSPLLLLFRNALPKIKNACHAREADKERDGKSTKEEESEEGQRESGKLEKLRVILEKAHGIEQDVEGVLSIIVSNVEQLETEKAAVEKEIEELSKVVNAGLDYKRLPSSVEAYVVKVKEGARIVKDENDGGKEEEMKEGKGKDGKGSVIHLKEAVAVEALKGKEGKGAYLVVFRRGQEGQVAKATQTSEFNKLGELAEWMVKLPEESPKGLLQESNKRLEEIKGELDKLKEKLKTECKKMKDLPLLIEQLEIYESEALAARQFARSSYTYIIEGWMPKKMLKSFEAELKKLFRNAVLVEVLKESTLEEKYEKIKDPADIPPTHIDDPKPVEPFEIGYMFSSLPRGNELNAALFYALTFPFIYGMIIGDVGYSIISLFIASFLKKKFPKSKSIRQISDVWIIASIGGMLWGIIFDEWLGASHFVFLKKLASLLSSIGIHITGPLYHGFHRTETFTILLLLSGLVGALHITLGQLLGAYTAFKEGHKKHMYAKLGWASATIGFTLLIAIYLGAFTGFAASVVSGAGWLLFIVGAGAIVWLEGFVGVVELPSIISNTASYFRIAAVGVSGVILAEIINRYTMPSFGAAGGGLVGVVVGLVMTAIYLSLHSVNTLIAMFESAVQGGRLHILEFAMKFIQGGGKVYKPFALPLMLKKR